MHIEDLSKPFDAKLLCLLKIGKREHLEELRKGRIFCRRLSFYKDIENQGQPFHDEHEGILAVFQSDKIRIRIGAEGIEPRYLSSETGLTGIVTISSNIDCRCFCLHAIHTGEWTGREISSGNMTDFKSYLAVPKSLEKFGNSVWVVTDFSAFIARLRSALDANGLGCKQGWVRYLDLSRSHGSVPNEMHGFVKSASYSDEREFRFLFYSQQTEKMADPFILDIGSLEDCSAIFTFKEFCEEMKVDFA